MEFKKFTTGCVEQIFEDGKCASQQFTAHENPDYEDGFGDVLPPEKKKLPEVQNAYQPFNMVQPNTEIVITVQGGLIQDIDFPSSMRGIKIIIKDYDTDGSSENVQKGNDEDGEYVRSEWDNFKGA